MDFASLVIRFALIALLIGAATAQTELLKLRRFDKTDVGVAWQPFEAPQCSRCEGSKRVPCRSCDSGKHRFAKRCAACNKKGASPCGQCTGKGAALDPLVHMPCARCAGQGRVQCRLCNGLSVMVVSADQRPCHGCSRKGSHKCVVCAGKAAVALDKAGAAKLETATAAQLERARTDVVLSLRAVEAVRKEFTSKQGFKDRDYGALHRRAMKAAARVLPRFAKEPDAVAEIVEDLQNKTGSRYFTLGPRVTGPSIYRDSIDAAVETLRYQRFALEMCLERARADEKARARGK